MTIEEKIKEAESLIDKANKLLTEVKEVQIATDDDILSNYWYAINHTDNYYINSFNNIVRCDAYDNDNIDKDDYSNYPTKEYAKQAQKLKEFNDKLLAFKWCYDREFEPKFTGLYGNRNYYVYYDSTEDKYTYLWSDVNKHNSIYFSSDVIAKKCCDWLNSLEEENKNE